MTSESGNVKINLSLNGSKEEFGLQHLTADCVQMENIQHHFQVVAKKLHWDQANNSIHCELFTNCWLDLINISHLLPFFIEVVNRVRQYNWCHFLFWPATPPTPTYHLSLPLSADCLLKWSRCKFFVWLVEETSTHILFQSSGSDSQTLSTTFYCGLFNI